MEGRRERRKELVRGGGQEEGARKRAQRTSSASTPRKSTPAHKNIHNFFKNEFQDYLLIMVGHLGVFVKVLYFVQAFISKVGLRNVLGTISEFSVRSHFFGSF